MKNVKWFVYSLFFLFTCQFSGASATTPPVVSLPVYQNIIADITLEYENTLLVGTLVLDNGDVFRISDYKERDDFLMNQWSIGDVVTIHTTSRNHQLALFAKDEQFGDDVEPYVVLDVIATPDDAGLVIVDISSDGEFVTLSDGSIWQFNWFNRFSTSYWDIGQRVLVHGNGNKNSYAFVNLDVAPIEDASEAYASYIPQ